MSPATSDTCAEVVKHKIAGFTLVEMSIMLVIIGLIIGGILLGKDIINQAEIRSQIQDIDKLKTAVMAFKLKYNCLPGDCVNGTTLFAAASQPDKVTNGNGDGRIVGYYYSGSTDNPHPNGSWISVPLSYAEWYSVFDYLAAAGMWSISQYDESVDTSNLPGVAYPELRIKSAGNGAVTTQTYILGGMLIGYEPEAGYVHAGHKVRLGACKYDYFGFPYVSFACGINPVEAHSLDKKIDDGKPYTGNTVITANVYNYRIPGWSGNTAYDATYRCGTYATNTYLTESYIYQRECAVEVSAGF